MPAITLGGCGSGVRRRRSLKLERVTARSETSARGWSARAAAHSQRAPPRPGPGSGDDPLVNWLFRNRQTGEITVGQAPNAALIVFLVAFVVHHAFNIRGNAGTGLTIVSTGALAVWSADELLRGVNPFRRLLGAVVLAGIVASLAVSRISRAAGDPSCSEDAGVAHRPDPQRGVGSMTSGVLETDSGLRRETSRVSFLMCPFCVRHLYPRQTTLDTNLRTPASQAGLPATSSGSMRDRCRLLCGTDDGDSPSLCGS